VEELGAGSGTDRVEAFMRLALDLLKGHDTER
jgi:hypothetical protein